MIEVRSQKSEIRKRHVMLCLLISIASLLTSQICLGTPAQITADVLKYLAIQDGGRVKPIGTFFRESLLLVTGKSRFEGRGATELCLSWIGDPRSFEKRAFVYLADPDLKKIIHIDAGAKYLSPLELVQNEDFQKFLKDVGERQKEKKKLNKTEQEALRLYARLDRFYSIAQGTALKIVPFTRVSKDHWISPVDLMPGHEQAEGLDVKLRFDFLAVFGTVVQTFKLGEKASFENAAKILVARQEEIAESSGIRLARYTIRKEIFYNELGPFERAWKWYLLAFGIFLISAFWKNAWVTRAGILAFAVGAVIHTVGLILRSIIAGRPPVTNMYESVIWVSWGVMFFAAILGLIWRQKLYLLTASLISALGLVLAVYAPTILDPHIRTLEPVLRSNFWLTVHVMTITLSYAAFALAWGLGHYNLYLLVWRKEDTTRLKRVNQFLYRTIQIGVILLAAGTILGGIWAHYSWGRFWGWDPKEVWTLIALLGYLAVLHGRFAGWLDEFGTAVGFVVAFLGVLMAWYGVNFVLGVGLHSYGFTKGGLVYVMGAVLLDSGFLGWVTWRHLHVVKPKCRISTSEKKSLTDFFVRS